MYIPHTLYPFIWQGTLECLPLFDFYEQLLWTAVQISLQHSDLKSTEYSTSLFNVFSSAGDGSQGLVHAMHVFYHWPALPALILIFENLPYYFWQWFYHFTLPPTVYECSNFCTSSPTPFFCFCLWLKVPICNPGWSLKCWDYKHVSPHSAVFFFILTILWVWGGISL
jgi:hypothetical protein